MSNDNPSNIIDLTFEQAYQELELTVQKLEAGHLSLAETLALYQRGMALAKHCNLQLDNAELTIKTLTASGDLVENEIM